MLWATATPPTGWLVADGTVYSRTTYKALFDVIGTTFGAPNSQTFNVPNTGGSTIRGVGGAFGFNTTGGADTVGLTVAQIPPHGHTITDPGHQHTCATQGTGFASSPGGFGNTASSGLTSVNTTSITMNTNTILDSGSTPTPTAVNIVNTYLTLNYIIRYA